MLRTLAIAFICCFTCYLVSPLIDPDLWWHLTVGRWILAHQSLPIVDNWNRFALGHSWVAYSWSVEVLYAMAYRFAAEQGLVILKLLSVGAVLF
ncbi:MAG: hypothetical protein KDD44_14370, partial [Bdellovibrionales bacterium]|nr:hypothetical protein [Bdellovibrionales bacterium]